MKGPLQRLSGRPGAAISHPVTLLVSAALALSLTSIDQGRSAGVSSRFATSEPASANGEILHEASEETGLIFYHLPGATGEFYLPEIMGSGLALIDYDGDGDLDVYLLQGACLQDPAPPQASGECGESSRLYRNDLNGQTVRFVDVTEKAGVTHRLFGMGGAVGDYDGDGDLDLYITNVGSNALFQNSGDGTFKDVTSEAGVDEPRWSTSAAFLDYDRDGRLDLYVVNYVDFTIKGNKKCHDSAGTPDYCSPSVYNPLPDRLFRSLGNGRFQDVTESSGIGQATGSGLGVTFGDFNSDGLTDIYVSNDGNPNHLWMNQGDGTFLEDGLLSGTAMNAAGKAEAGMGVAVADFDSDTDEDILVANITQETNTLYVNDGVGNFLDSTTELGLATDSIPLTTFGIGWFDYDHDGRLDLFLANGAVAIVESLRGEPYPYHQKNLLYRQFEDGSLKQVGLTDASMQLSEVSRGAAFGDMDLDGDIDIVISNNKGPARLYLNQSGPAGHWLQVDLRAKRNNARGIAALVVVVFSDGSRMSRRVTGASSYLTAGDLRVHFGLGAGKTVSRILVQWPDGSQESWDLSEVDRLITLQEGTGNTAGG